MANVQEQKYRVAIITSSDSCFANKRIDLSGQKIAEICLENDFDVCSRTILPDEQEELSNKMKEICDKGEAELILTTGGTGFSSRDCMPEATKAVGERYVPGISEAIRAYSLQITKRAMLSRGVSVIRKSTLIVNLPGSPKAVDESLTYIMDQLPHALGLLKTPVEESKTHE